MKTCIIYICCDYTEDKRHCLFLKNSIASFIKYYKNSEIDIYLLHLGKDSYLNFEFPYNITYIDVRDLYFDMEKYFVGVQEKNHPAFLKIKIPQLDFFYNYDNVLYLDLDTEFKNNKLSEFFEIPDEGKEIIGVAESAIFKNRRQLFELVKRYDIFNLKHQYINTGVLLFKPKNLPKNIANEHCNKILNFIQYDIPAAHRAFTFDNDIWEQTILQFEYKIKSIHDIRYNSNIEFLDNQVIMHYFGSAKKLFYKKLR